MKGDRTPRVSFIHHNVRGCNVGNSCGGLRPIQPMCKSPTLCITFNTRYLFATAHGMAARNHDHTGSISSIYLLPIHLHSDGACTPSALITTGAPRPLDMLFCCTAF